MIGLRQFWVGSMVCLSLGMTACGGENQQGVAPTTPPETPPTAVVEEPNQDTLAMTCTGSITVNDIDFTAHFTREGGFSRIELARPATGEVFAESFLSYDGQNDQGEDIWRGDVAGMADVTLVHLAQGPAQIGDEVSVGYDGQWGRGTCN